MKIFESIFISEEQAERAFHLVIDMVPDAKSVMFGSMRGGGARRHSVYLTVPILPTCLPCDSPANSNVVCNLTCFRGIFGKSKCTLSFHLNDNVLSVDIPHEKFEVMYNRAVMLKTSKAHSELIASIGNYNETKNTKNV